MGHVTRRAFTAVAAALLSGTLAPAGSAHADPVAGGRSRRGFPVRGLWIATVENIDWPRAPGPDAAAQRRELVELLDLAVERRLNTVMLQVRPSADALWPSPYEPWSAWLTGEQGRDPGWDPLAFAVREAHERGLKLHAWFNPYRVANHGDRDRLAAHHPARRHPDWAVPYGGKLYYNPGLPHVRRFVQDAMFDAVERYAVDGVHWDDYFYPYPVAGESFDDDEAFRLYGRGFTDRAAWRRDNVDRLVREAGERLREVRPEARFGVSPFAVWRNADTDPAGSDTHAGVQTYDDLYADTRGWVRDRLVDYVVPQVYWHLGFPPADYATLVRWWDEVCRGTGVELYIGEALYKAGLEGQPEPWHDPAELSRHLAFCRHQPRVRGHVFFSARHVADDPLGAMSRVVADHYR
ncbi:glycoside hydrolase family 10 protein [Streptomyces sp. WMMC1477]|uniref:glycoside hydrolase family 10 protein n=1 Tax=Streptomyces sp. WMMC1477 TaxID=3015155 RepID=UPI0022B6E37A|nr:family 10 glycosylhydrolase [Streptomyces sp. WMMC1477]MCZ7430363.1 family 10 glycosylhydrolase [Streptomyces sp. WMMC1477]